MEHHRPNEKHMANLETITITVEIKEESEKAIKIFDGKKETWIPKSQIVEKRDSTEKELQGVLFDLEIYRWLAHEKELI